MTLKLAVDRDALARVCRSHSVRRLRVFGSATSEHFDTTRSDVDLLVEFDADADDLFDVLRTQGRPRAGFARRVDLVMADAVRNPFFEAQAFGSAEDLYAT